MSAAVRIDLKGPYLDGLREVPFPHQEAFWRDPRRFCFGFCGVRAGKTEGAAEKFSGRVLDSLAAEILRLAEGGAPANDGLYQDEWRPASGRPTDDDEPRALFWVVAPTYKLTQTAWRKVRRILRRLGPLVVSAKAGVVWLRTGIRIEMRTGRDPDQLQAERVAGVLVDEICTLAEAAWNQILNRVTDSGGWVIGIGSPRPGTWAKSRIWDRLRGVERGSAGDASAGVHHWTTLDNPHIDPANIAAARESLPDKWFRRDFLAGWDTFEGLIYDDYALGQDAAIVDVDLEQLRGRAIDMVIDFGLTRPALMLIAEIDGIAPDGEAGDVVVEEIVLSDVKLATLLDRLVAVLKRLGVSGVTPYGDPAGRARNTQTRRPDMDLVCEVLQRAGLLRGRFMYPRTNAERDILNGIAAVQSRLLSSTGRRRLFVSRHLTTPERLSSYPPGVAGIHQSLLGYSWKAGRTDVADKDGVHDHFPDGLRYWCVKRRGLVSQAPEFDLAPPEAAPGFGKHTDFGGWVDSGGGWD
jgi:hypothetical protein